MRHLICNVNQLNSFYIIYDSNVSFIQVKNQPGFSVLPIVVRVISWLSRGRERFYQHHLWTPLGQLVPFAIVYAHVQPKVKNKKS